MAQLKTSVSTIENPNVASINSWISVQNDQNRSLFAQAVVPISNNYDVEVVKDTAFRYGNYNKLVVLETTTFANLTANGKIISSGLNATFPVNFELESSVQGFKLTSGAVIAYK